MPDKVTIKQKPTESEELKKLLRENLEYTKACYALLEKVKRYMVWQRIFVILKLLIIMVPIILGIIYLPPLLEKAISAYKDLLR
jgi:hypothetical protein